MTDANGTIVGIVSEGDLMRREESGADRPAAWWLAILLSPEEQAAKYVKSHGRRARDVMTRHVITVHDTATLEEIADILERQRIKRVPVLRDGDLVGIVSRANLLHGLVTMKLAKAATSDDETIRAETNVVNQFINVTVSDGTVHLWGTVDSEAERDAVRTIAENTVGVHEIDDHLSVLPPGCGQSCGLKDESTSSRPLASSN